jgi:hypothetical protein
MDAVLCFILCQCKDFDLSFYIIVHIWPQKLLYQYLCEFGKVVEKGLSMGSGADSSGRNCRASYRFAKDEISGCINIALWHAIGHEVSHSQL